MPRLSADQWEAVRAERDATGNIGTRAAAEAAMQTDAEAI